MNNVVAKNRGSSPSNLVLLLVNEFALGLLSRYDHRHFCNFQYFAAESVLFTLEVACYRKQSFQTEKTLSDRWILDGEIKVVREIDAFLLLLMK